MSAERQKQCRQYDKKNVICTTLGGRADDIVRKNTIFI